MKKLILILAMMMPLIANAQFSLTPEGFKTADEKDFYVVDIEGTQADLFKRAQTAITELFVSANDVVTANAPDIISLNGFTNAIYLKQMGRKAVFDTKFTLKIMFKDNKVRFNAPHINSMGLYNKGRVLDLYMGCGGGSGLNDYGHIFKKDGKVRYKDAVASAEEYFNGLINAIVEKIKSPVVESEW